MNEISNIKAFGVIGDPIAQSLSPDIHNFWIKKSNISAYYNKFHLQTKCATEDIKALQRFDVQGLNVTMPYKEYAIKAAVNVSETAEKIGVANTLKSTPSGWYADNTDAVGFLNALLSCLENKDLTGKAILLIGAGGAARAVAYILSKQNVDLTIVNRTVSKADDLITELAPTAKSNSLSDLTNDMDAADIVVNATSLKAGLVDSIEFPDGNGRLFFDLSYGKAPEEILRKASQSGWQTEDGLRMLVEQAALSHELWHGETPDVEAAYQMCQEKIR